MERLKNRIDLLEANAKETAKQLPHVMPDSTTDGELARLRKRSSEVFREDDPAFIALFV